MREKRTVEVEKEREREKEGERGRERGRELVKLFYTHQEEIKRSPFPYIHPYIYAIFICYRVSCSTCTFMDITCICCRVSCLSRL